MINDLDNSFFKLPPDLKSVRRTPMYFGPDGKRLLGWLHSVPNAPEHFDVGVVICPPLAVEYMSTYRSMRYVADYFALAGIPAFRFDYHGTGDSSGYNDQGCRLDDWKWSIEQACDEMQRLSGCTRVGLFGLRMGATLAALVSEKIDVDFLVLWAALESGRKYTREIKALQMTGVSQVDEVPVFLEAGGLVYWSQTVAALSKVNLLKTTPRVSRVLIIPRDDLSSDTKLQETWESQGVTVSQAEWSGSSDMCLLALQALVPHESIIKIVDWVKSRINSPGKSFQDSVDQSPLISTRLAFHRENDEKNRSVLNIQESIVRFGVDNVNFGILTEPVSLRPSGLPIVIFANSGATHRVGPSRLYVLLARELASLGFRCLRFDIPGLGDSIVEDYEQENRDYIEQSSDFIRQALESFGPEYRKNEYVMTGLCSGAYFSFHAALDLKNINIVESMLINPLTFYWHKGMEFDTSSTKNFGYWNWYKQAIRNPKSWGKLIRGGADYGALCHTIKNRFKILFLAKVNAFGLDNSTENLDKSQDNLHVDLIEIAARNTHLSFILARSDPGYDILMTMAGKTAKNLIKSGELKVYFIEDADHTFSKYQPRCDAINVIVKHLTVRYGH